MSERSLLKWSYKRQGCQAGGRSLSLRSENSSRVCGDYDRYFKPNHNIFFTLTKWLVWLNLSRANAQRRDREEIQNVTKKLHIGGFAETYLANIFFDDWVVFIL